MKNRLVLFLVFILLFSVTHAQNGKQGKGNIKDSVQTLPEVVIAVISYPVPVRFLQPSDFKTRVHYPWRPERWWPVVGCPSPVKPVEKLTTFAGRPMQHPLQPARH